MNVPALAARAPLGETQTIVGTGASSRAETIRCVASRLPPGVLIVMIRAGERFVAGPLHRFLDVAGHHVVDDAGQRHHVDRGGRVAGRGRGGGRTRVRGPDGRWGSEGSDDDPGHRGHPDQAAQAGHEPERAYRVVHQSLSISIARRTLTWRGSGPTTATETHATCAA